MKVLKCECIFFYVFFIFLVQRAKLKITYLKLKASKLIKMFVIIILGGSKNVSYQSTFTCDNKVRDGNT